MYFARRRNTPTSRVATDCVLHNFSYIFDSICGRYIIIYKRTSLFTTAYVRSCVYDGNRPVRKVEPAAVPPLPPPLRCKLFDARENRSHIKYKTGQLRSRFENVRNVSFRQRTFNNFSKIGPKQNDNRNKNQSQNQTWKTKYWNQAIVVIIRLAISVRVKIDLNLTNSIRIIITYNQRNTFYRTTQ